MSNFTFSVKQAYMLFISVLVLGFLVNPAKSVAQIYEPEGLSMPGAWNGWTNPPVNNLALASSTQVPNGRVLKINSGIVRWQTIFSVAASGGDVVGGTYNWLFTSGPTSNPWSNKWGSVAIIANTLQTYTKEGTDNTITVVNGKWYTMNWHDNGYNDTEAIFMQTSAAPVGITTVAGPASATAGVPVVINITLTAAKCAEEIIYLHYTTDGWTTSVLVQATMTGTTGTAQIPGQVAGTAVSYKVFSSTVSTITDNFDLYSIKVNNNAGSNYTYAVGSPTLSWVNLQGPASGTIAPSQQYDVYARALIPGVTGQVTPAANLQAWIGYSTTNTDPSTWTNWIAAPYFGVAGNNDEFKANLGSQISTVGTYYYASRFKLGTASYVYGGYSATGGGFWNGTANISGVLTIALPDVGWCNLQSPATASIAPQQDLLVYGQVWIDGITGQGTATTGLQAWIGYSTTNTNPDTWTNWMVADFNSAVGNNDEFQANLGAQISADGTYYYAYRYKYQTNAYVYGGYSSTGGGFWDGTANVSGVLTVTTPPPATIAWANLQSPESASIALGDQLVVFGQVWIDGLTGSGSQTPGLQAWVGYSADNTDPNTWTNWVLADYNGIAGSNDEFYYDLGGEITAEGTYYYATRYKYADGSYVFGGYSPTGGGFWDGFTNVSGVLIATAPIVSIDWANLQWPDTALIVVGNEYLVYAQAWIDGVTGQTGQTAGLQCWIGFSNENTDPSTWVNWLEATYNQASGSNDEFVADLATLFPSFGTYYYASRFKYENTDYVYGGYSDVGGGFWDGTDNISGYVVVLPIGIAEPQMSVDVYPNPVTERLTIKGTGLVRVVLTNALGQVVFQSESAEPAFTIDFTNLNSGPYSLTLIKGNQTQTRMVIKP